MTDFIDDWLSQLGTTAPVSAEVVPDTSGHSTALALQHPYDNDTPAPTSADLLTDSDIDNMLNSLTSYESQEADAEEITEEPLPPPSPASPASSNSSVADSAVGPVSSANSAAPSIPSASPPPEPLLPPNSPTLIMDDTTSRFSGTEWYNEIHRQNVLIAGCGGIGSWLAFNIARLHPDAIHLFDSDIVETANMSGQLFSHNDIGMDKTRAVYSFISSHTTMSRIYTYEEYYTEDSHVTPIMMCGFDNMAARKVFFDNWMDFVNSLHDIEDRKQCLFLDGRLSVDTLQVLCIRGDDARNMDRYNREFLFSDEEADETVCSMKQTTYMACMIGSLMTNLFVNHVAGLLDPIIPYDLPFFTEYNAQNMLFKVEN